MTARVISRGAVCLALFLLFQLFVRPRAGRRSWPAGRLFVLVGLSYAVWRFAVEFIRDDPERGLHGPFSTSQWVSLVVVALAVAWLVRQRRPATRSDGAAT